MADPLSIAASVGGLALLARDVIKQIKTVTANIREARPQLQRLLQAVAVLYGVLESLSLIIDEMRDVHIADTAPSIAIQACHDTLEDIKRILQKCEADTDKLTSMRPPANAASLTLSTKSGTWQSMKQKTRWAVEKDEVEKLLVDLEKHKSLLSLALTQESMSSIVKVLRKQDEAVQCLDEIKRQQSEIRDAQIQEAKRRLRMEQRKMLDEFSDTQPEDFFKKHIALHQRGTCSWFLRSSEYAKFIGTAKSTLWLYGIPGAGKSVMSATIIEQVNSQRTDKFASAFFFCEYANKDTQSCRHILGSIARQLALQNESALDELTEFHDENTNLGQQRFSPNDTDLLGLVQKMSANFDATIIIIDGLDECLTDRASVVEVLSQLNSDDTGTIKTLFASREELDIKECLASFESIAIAASNPTSSSMSPHSSVHDSRR